MYVKYILKLKQIRYLFFWLYDAMQVTRRSVCGTWESAEWTLKYLSMQRNVFYQQNMLAILNSYRIFHPGAINQVIYGWCPR